MSVYYTSGLQIFIREKERQKQGERARKKVRELGRLRRTFCSMESDLSHLFEPRIAKKNIFSHIVYVTKFFLIFFLVTIFISQKNFI